MHAASMRESESHTPVAQRQRAAGGPSGSDNPLVRRTVQPPPTITSARQAAGRDGSARGAAPPPNAPSFMASGSGAGPGTHGVSPSTHISRSAVGGVSRGARVELTAASAPSNGSAARMRTGSSSRSSAVGAGRPAASSSPSHQRVRGSSVTRSRPPSATAAAEQQLSLPVPASVRAKASGASPAGSAGTPLAPRHAHRERERQGGSSSSSSGGVGSAARGAKAPPPVIHSARRGKDAAPSAPAARPPAALVPAPVARATDKPTREADGEYGGGYYVVDDAEADDAEDAEAEAYDSSLNSSFTDTAPSLIASVGAQAIGATRSSSSRPRSATPRARGLSIPTPIYTSGGGHCEVGPPSDDEDDDDDALADGNGLDNSSYDEEDEEMAVRLYMDGSASRRRRDTVPFNRSGSGSDNSSSSSSSSARPPLPLSQQPPFRGADATDSDAASQGRAAAAAAPSQPISAQASAGSNRSGGPSAQRLYPPPPSHSCAPQQQQHRLSSAARHAEAAAEEDALRAAHSGGGAAAPRRATCPELTDAHGGPHAAGAPLLTAGVQTPPSLAWAPAGPRDGGAGGAAHASLTSLPDSSSSGTVGRPTRATGSPAARPLTPSGSVSARLSHAVLAADAAASAANHSPHAAGASTLAVGASSGDAASPSTTPRTAHRHRHRATPALTVKPLAAAASAAALPPLDAAAFHCFSLHDAFFLNDARTAWLVDDLVLAKCLEYVRLMGYQHPLLRWDRAMGRSSHWSSTAAIPSPLVRTELTEGGARAAAASAASASAGTRRAPTYQLKRRQPVCTAEKLHLSSLFLSEDEAMRWMNEQEYVIGVILLCCARAQPATRRGGKDRHDDERHHTAPKGGLQAHRRRNGDRDSGSSSRTHSSSSHISGRSSIDSSDGRRRGGAEDGAHGNASSGSARSGSVGSHSSRGSDAQRRCRHRDHLSSHAHHGSSAPHSGAVSPADDEPSSAAAAATDAVRVSVGGRSSSGSHADAHARSGARVAPRPTPSPARPHRQRVEAFGRSPSSPSVGARTSRERNGSRKDGGRSGGGGCIPVNVHPIQWGTQLARAQMPTWGGVDAFASVWETQVRLVLGTASPTHQRVFVNREDGLTFSSDCESGNLHRVERAAESYVYFIWLEADANSDKRIWFRFSVSGAREGRTLRIRLQNAAPHTKLYRENGMSPVFRDGRHVPHWTPVDQCSFRTVNNDLEGEVSFSITARSNNDSIQVAFCAPYTYADLLCHLCQWHSLVRSSVCGIRFEERVLCRSPDGRKQHLLIITSSSTAPKGSGVGAAAGRPRKGADASKGRRRLSVSRDDVNLSNGSISASPTGAAAGKAGAKAAATREPVRGPFSNFASGKKVVLVSARVHPGEVTASHGVHGLISFLLSADPRAVRLREHFLFFIVPMLNPDGVSRGHSRMDQYGDNLNRCYNDPDPITQPTVYALKKVYETLHRSFSERFMVYLDFHSHASQSSGFVFGNCLPIAVQHWNLVLPKLIELHVRESFSFGLCRFGRKHMLSKDGASRVLFGESLIHSYTVELPHFTDRVMYGDTFAALNNKGGVIDDEAASAIGLTSGFARVALEEAASTGCNGVIGAGEVGGTLGTRDASADGVMLLRSASRTASQGPGRQRPAIRSSSSSAKKRSNSEGAGARRKAPAAPRGLALNGNANKATRRGNSVGLSEYGRRGDGCSPLSVGDVAAAANNGSSSGGGGNRRSARHLQRLSYEFSAACQPIFMPSVLAQSASVGRACALALLDYCGAGSKQPSAELTAFGGLERVLGEVKRVMRREARATKARQKRPAMTPQPVQLVQPNQLLSPPPLPQM